MRNRIAAFAAACAMGVAGWLLAVAPATALVRDAEMEALLAELSAPILAAAGYQSGDVRVVVWNHPDINALATGDNRIILFSGLIEATGDPTELASVIAHEAAHLANGHVVKRTEEFVGVNTAATMLSLLAVAGASAGSLDPGVALGGLAASQQVAERSFLVYTRSQEAAADAQAVAYLERAGFDPAGLVRFLHVLEREQETWGEMDPYAQTHPAADLRIDNISRRLTGAGPPVDPGLDYRYRRVRAKLAAFLGDPVRILERLDEAKADEITLLSRAIASHRSGDRAGARAAMDRLLALVPGDPYYLELSGQILFESGATVESVAAYRQALAKAPEAAQIQVGLGQALLALETDVGNREALAVLEEGVRGDERDARARYLLAQALGRTGNRPRADLMIAEEQMIRGNLQGAVGFARRAFRGAPEGSPTWFQAQDILAALGAPLDGGR